MKRLLKISFDSLFFSFVPIISWFALGILVDKNLINVFTLTYPLQFIYSLIKSIFGVSPNICKEKEKNSNIVMSGIIGGIVVGFIVFGLFVLNADNYIKFMNMDITIYHNFCIYSMIQLYIHSIFVLLIEKLYYEEKNTKANIYTITFNLLNFICLVVTSIIFKNQLYIIFITLIIILLYVIIMLIIEWDKFKLDLNIISKIKYDSVDVINNVLYFLIFLFGLSNASDFGIQYIVAINFVSLITDCQWDSFEAISEVAKIDLAKKKFNYKEHIKNAYKLLFILLITVFLMFLFLHNMYNLDLKLVSIYLIFEIVNFAIYPIYRINTCSLQLEYSTILITTNKLVSGILRLIVSLLPTPFCTCLGQICSSIYQFITTNIMMKKSKSK